MSATPPLPEIVPGLYQIILQAASPETFGSPDASPVFSYFLTQSDPSPAVPFTLADSWADSGLVGWYLFLPEQIPPSDAAQFVSAARAELPQPYAGDYNQRILVWLAAVDPAAQLASLPLTQPNPSSLLRTPSPLQPAYIFSWPPLSLSMAYGVAVALDAPRQALSLTTDPGNNGLIQLLYPGGQPNWYDWYTEDNHGWAITLPLAGLSAGGLQTRLGLDFGLLADNMGCGLRYFQEQAGAIAILEYPIYPPRAAGQPKPGFVMALHPLLVQDSTLNRLTLDFGGASPNPFQQATATLQAGNLLTTAGGAISFVPLPPPGGSPAAYGASGAPGFAFCATPIATTAGSPGGSALYLAPIGTYRVTTIDAPTGSPAPSGPAQWMCGLSGLEYIEIEIDDLLGLESAMPALVRSPGQSPFTSILSQPSGSSPLADDFTTSWFRFPFEDQPRRYFGQAQASVYFDSAPSGSFAPPSRALLADVSTPTLFPLAPYGGVAANNGYAAIESAALAGLRQSWLTLHSLGPRFLPQPALHAASLGTRLNTAETKQGFLVQLNPEVDGGSSWRSVQFARSPEFAGQYLSITGQGSPEIVGKPIATELLKDGLFLVVSNATALGLFANEISIAGFTFLLDVATAGPIDGNSTILIFKYNTQATLVDLALNTGLWSSPDMFVADQAGTLQQIRLSLAAAGLVPDGGLFASPTSDDSFANFRAIATDPLWTGMIALNCAIDGNGMPPDLQMLLGGINGQLRVHHLGLQSNKLTTGAEGAEIAQSSLFGVISYPSLTQPSPPHDDTDDFAYELLLLNVVFSNSTVQDFKARVGVTINRLFSREVMLVSTPASQSPLIPANTLEIAGRYQLQDGVATVSFVTEQPFYYEFPIPEGSARVLRQVAFNRAALAPVSSVPLGSPPVSPSSTAVVAQLSLEGALWFNQSPFSQATGLDLFSFGCEPLTNMKAGLALSGLAVNIAFTLGPDGAIAGKLVATCDPSTVKLTPGSGMTRPHSLLDSLPLQLSNFLAPAGGFTASSLGALPVHVLQLEAAEPSGSPSVTSPAVVQPAAQPPNVTTAPLFGLEFDMPLGSLGALSNATVGLMAKLVIGWGPSRLVPDTDAATVLVQLPQLFAGYGSFQLQGILKTVFGDANLLMVELPQSGGGLNTVYAVLFNNVQLSVFGKTLPPGVVIDFLIFAGASTSSNGTNTNNLAWFLGATTDQPSPPSSRASRAA
jgi:hypothetical protein